MRESTIKEVEKEVEIEVEDKETFNNISPPLPFISKRKSLPEDVDIITPLDIVNNHIKNIDLSLFLVNKIYPLVFIIMVGLEEEEPYILQTPLMKITSKNTLHAFDQESLRTFVSTTDPLLPYFTQLYEEYRKRSFLLYRFYRCSKNIYGLTFITSGSPHILHICMGISSSSEINKIGFNLYDLSEDSIDSIEVSTNKSLYCTFYDKFSKDFRIGFPSNRRYSHSIYKMHNYDFYQEGDYDKWTRLILFSMITMKDTKRMGSAIKMDDKRQAFIFY